MDCKGICKDGTFIFTWVIENFSYCWQKQGKKISSPQFVTAEERVWRLELYPKGSEDKNEDFLSFYIYRAPKIYRNYDLGTRYMPPCAILSFELSLIASDGSVLVSKLCHINELGTCTSLFVKREEIFRIRRKDYLPGDVLTARCKIWHENREVKNYGHCFARTRIGVERRSFVWNIKHFNSFRESICEITSASANESIMTLKLFSTSGQKCETFIRVEVCAHDKSLKFSTFRFHLVDSAGNRTECLNEEFTFTENNKTALFTFTNFTKEKLIENQDLFLPNCDLQLYCQCAFATGIVSGEIEYICRECPSIQKVNLTSNDSESKEISSDSTIVLTENLESSYKENFLCDTKLKTNTRTFPAHKFILGARSPVFKAMFSNDMREKNSECVDIEDLDDDTVQRMLLYMYTAKLLDLQWDSACNLYSAADKYEILCLKSKCSSFLKDNLTQDNACDLLILADRHQDEDLKSAVQDYILNNRDIFNTNEWELFMKTNMQLAAGLMHLMLKKLM